METNNLAEKISRLISPEFGTKDELNEDDKSLIDALRGVASQIESSDESIRNFKNVIRKEDRCGFASGGSIDKLLNTDTGRRYRVTVRTYWRQGINEGQYDNTFLNEAGGKLVLGCTDSGNIPVAYYNRQVVGESPA